MLGALSARSLAAVTRCSANLSAAARWERSFSARASGAWGAAPCGKTCCWGLGAGGAAAFMGMRGAIGAGLATGCEGLAGSASEMTASGALVNSPEMRGKSLPPIPKRSRQLRLSVSFVEL